MTFSEKVLSFYSELQVTDPLPEGVRVMNPYRDEASFTACRAFYRKYYHNDHKRYLILGINPGRYGAGTTGVPFTDPIKLEAIFGIRNSLPKKPELSAAFIHKMIDAFGGYERFFSRFFINSVSPLGFVSEGKNLNYYDTPALKKSLDPFMRKSIRSMLSLGIHRDAVFCLGEGENYRYLKSINSQENYFRDIIPLAHPRFIMQYKRKQLTHYLEDYLQKLKGVHEDSSMQTSGSGTEDKAGAAAR